jgi:prevent-host-death family protein
MTNRIIWTKLLTIVNDYSNLIVMEEIAISKFKATCLKLLQQVKNTGESLIVTKKGTPVAVINPPPPAPKKQSSFGIMKDKMSIHGDIVSPLPSDDWDVLKE